MKKWGQFIMESKYKNSPEISWIQAILISLCVTTPVLALVGIKILLTTM